MLELTETTGSKEHSERRGRTKRSNNVWAAGNFKTKEFREKKKRELALEILRPEDPCYFKTWHFIPLEISLFSVWVHQPFVFSSIFLIKIPILISD